MKFRNTICFVMMVVLLISLSMGSLSYANTNVKGDVNGDGSINSIDIFQLKRQFVYKDIEDLALLDINGDGYFNARDLLNLIHIVLNDPSNLELYTVSFENETIQATGIFNVYNNRFDLPLSSILRTLGFKFNWSDTTYKRASILYDNFTGGIIVSDTKCKMYNYLIGDLDFNYIGLSDKSRFYVSNKELYLDLDTLQHTLYLLKIPVDIKIDDVNKSVNITADTNANEYKYDLKVNENVIGALDYADLTIHRPQLPFTAIVEALGMNIEWESENVASVTDQCESYVLDIKDCTMLKKDDLSTPNYLLSAPGEPISYYTVDQELYLDNITLRQALYQLHMPVDINIDHRNRVIEVVSVTEAINYDYTLMVDGETVTTLKDLRVYKRTAELPVSLIFEALGATVVWESDMSATIDYMDQTYYLDTYNCYLGNNGNYIMGAPGGYLTWYKVPYELYLDSLNYAETMKFLGFPVKVEIDNDNNIISITSKH